jgi:hypothetical protein
VPVTSRNPGHRSAAADLTVVLDLAAPIIVFYGLRWAGAGVFVALIAGAIAPTLSMLVKLTKDRRVDGLAVAVLGVLLLSAGVSLIDGSPQFLAAKDCVLTAAWGGWFFLSLRGARPLTFRFSRPLLEGRKVFDFRQRRWAPPSQESWDQVWQRSPRFRRIWTVTTVIWGVALLIDAAVRVAMAIHASHRRGTRLQRRTMDSDPPRAADHHQHLLPAQRAMDSPARRNRLDLTHLSR